MDRKSYGTLFNAYMRVKKEYKSAGIVKYKYKEYQEEAQGENMVIYENSSNQNQNQEVYKL